MDQRWRQLECIPPRESTWSLVIQCSLKVKSYCRNPPNRKIIIKYLSLEFHSDIEA